MKPATSGQLGRRYNRYSNKKKIEILYAALDFMQQYNGRSREDCIFMAMGYGYEDEETGLRQPLT